jgi:dihydroorotase
MSRIILFGGRVIDPANGIDGLLDVVIRDGVISQVGPNVGAKAGDDVRNVVGCLVVPGLVDAHVHFRDPGLTYKEDLASGAQAALAGGFVRVCCMPNTEPALDTAERIADVVSRGARTGIHIHPIGTITIGRKLAEIAPLREMAEAGAIGFSDDGESTQSIDAMRDALRLSIELERPIMVHCEDPLLAGGGGMNRGAVAVELGDDGIPARAEEDYIERDIQLAAETGGWLHVLHVSTARGARLIKAAKEAGVRVTAEVMPHHLTLTDEWVAGRRRFAGEPHARMKLETLDPDAKVNPPLRPEADALGLAGFVRDGTFDFIATDHAPHALSDKPADLGRAASGMLGLELAIPLLGEVVRRGDFDWPLVIEKLTASPARTLRLPGGNLTPGGAADVAVIDTERTWVVDDGSLRGRSRNTPLKGLEVRGRAVMTIVGGRILHDEL